MLRLIDRLAGPAPWTLLLREGDDGGAGGGDGDDGGAGGGDGDGDGDGGAKKTSTVLDGDGDDGEGGGGGEPAWRREMAGDDEEAYKRLQRRPTLRSVYEWAVNAEKKMKQGGRIEPPAEDAPEEEVKAYREAMGIPEAAEAYEVKLPDGVEIADDEKPLFDSFKEFAHKANYTQAQFDAAMEWYNGFQASEESSLKDIDDRFWSEEAEPALRDEWGADYRGNMQAIAHAFEGAEATIKVTQLDGSEADMPIMEAILSARMPDGRKVGAHPETVKFFANVGRQLMPLDVFVPEGETSGSLESRMDEIKKIMETDPDRYDRDKKLQAEHQKLIEARLAHEERSNKGRK